VSNLEERLEASVCEDSTIARAAQVELVRALLRRDIPAEGPDPAGDPHMADVPAEQTCGRCSQPVDEYGYCDSCSHTNPLRRTR
jgi:hypothetical protein